MLGKHLGRSERLARKFQAWNVYAIAVRSPHKKEATGKTVLTVDKNRVPR
jgi:hypothetical protein